MPRHRTSPLCRCAGAEGRACYKRADYSKIVREQAMVAINSGGLNRLLAVLRT